MNPWFGPFELLILVGIVLLLFGPKRLPEIGRGLGRGMREFKASVTGKDDKDAKRTAITASAAEQQAPDAAGTRDAT